MIVKRLIQENICFAIVQSVSWLTRKKYLENTDYEILAFKKDIAKLRFKEKSINKDIPSEFTRFTLQNDDTYPSTQRNPKDVVSTLLNHKEVAEFIDIKDEFFETTDFAELGKVYSLYDQPFNETYNAKRNQATAEPQVLHS